MYETSSSILKCSDIENTIYEFLNLLSQVINTIRGIWDNFQYLNLNSVFLFLILNTLPQLVLVLLCSNCYFKNWKENF